jgi:hypothetical protein
VKCSLEDVFSIKSFFFRTDFRKGVKRLSQSKYFIDPDIEHVLVFPSTTKFFDYEIYLNRHILLMDKVYDLFIPLTLFCFFFTLS